MTRPTQEALAAALAVALTITLALVAIVFIFRHLTSVRRTVNTKSFNTKSFNTKSFNSSPPDNIVWSRNCKGRPAVPSYGYTDGDTVHIYDSRCSRCT